MADAGSVQIMQRNWSLLLIYFVFLVFLFLKKIKYLIELFNILEGIHVILFPFLIASRYIPVQIHLHRTNYRTLSPEGKLQGLSRTIMPTASRTENNWPLF